MVFGLKSVEFHLLWVGKGVTLLGLLFSVAFVLVGSENQNLLVLRSLEVSPMGFYLLC